jgi:hypothetical protein
MREAEKLKRLWLALAARRSSLGGEPAELDRRQVLPALPRAQLDRAGRADAARAASEEPEGGLVAGADGAWSMITLSDQNGSAGRFEQLISQSPLFADW